MTLWDMPVAAPFCRPSVGNSVAPTIAEITGLNGVPHQVAKARIKLYKRQPTAFHGNSNLKNFEEIKRI